MFRFYKYIFLKKKIPLFCELVLQYILQIDKFTIFFRIFKCFFLNKILKKTLIDFNKQFAKTGKNYDLETF